jgi:hypothetical protein
VAGEVVLISLSLSLSLSLLGEDRVGSERPGWPISVEGRQAASGVARALPGGRDLVGEHRPVLADRAPCDRRARAVVEASWAGRCVLRAGPPGQGARASGWRSPGLPEGGDPARRIDEHRPLRLDQVAGGRGDPTVEAP